MDLDIRGKTALVLGGGGGLGRSISVVLAEQGVQVVAADVNSESLKETQRQLDEVGGKHLSLRWDITSLTDLRENATRIESELGGVDILINNTGGPPPSGASGVAPETWRKFFDSMVLSVIAITDRFLPGMKERSWGRIITSASSGIVSPIPNLAVSNALRMTLLGWSKSLAREVAIHGVTSNLVVPGRIATDRIRSLDEMKAARENRPIEAVVKESVESIPMARYGLPHEYANVVAFLASNCASYITGAVIRVDGGYIQSI
ncbi:SDR family oxidoreductase [Paraburkholderia caribensis]|uniref:SDR family oxidoreductase n=1 Tax=Paraburkholderia caribensis TaxID=75105 RepID=UPI00078B9ACA|nr:SDR family oxidoreductase [Paraburkholderia caribensis]AMV48466.1 3-oxoacyl-ACP reductase [Paraburkholderia caribensis]